MDDELTGLTASNEGRIAGFAAQGIQINGVDQMRLEAMIVTLLGDRLEEALWKFQRQLAARLDSVAAQVEDARANLATQQARAILLGGQLPPTAPPNLRG